MYLRFRGLPARHHADRARHFVARRRPDLDHRPPGGGHLPAADPATVSRTTRTPRAQQALVAAGQRPEESTRFVFVQPRVDTTGAEAADRGRRRRIRIAWRDRAERRSRTTIRCRSRAATPRAGRERGATGARVRRGRGRIRQKGRERRRPTPSGESQPKLPESPSALQFPARAAVDGKRRQRPADDAGRRSLGDALRNLQRYVRPREFDNPQGGGQFGPEIQFDTKGVEFGPWVRRFIAQVKRNWIPMIPYSAMSMRGHVVITFNVHKERLAHRPHGRRTLSDRRVQQRRVRRADGLEPDAAAAARVPVRQGVLHVTFFYNETPPR